MICHDSELERAATKTAIQVHSRHGQATYAMMLAGGVGLSNSCIGPFELNSPIAAGGMGEVWLGEHLPSGRRVAVKVLMGRMTQSPRFKSTFRNEARAMSNLRHSHIVPIFDFGEMKPADTASSQFGYAAPYIVMEYFPHTLTTFNPVRGWRSLKRMLLELLDALAHAHARGVVHRDLKPGNILIDESGLSHISDFGIAFGADDDAMDAESLRAAGTPEYMAPEQCHGMWRDFGPWTDLYALGCITFELCSGDPPFQGANQMSVMLTKLKGKVPEFLPRFAVPPDFDQWVKRLLARDPHDRFQRAADAAHALQSLSSDFDGALDEMAPNEFEPLDRDTMLSPRTGGGFTHSLGKLHQGKRSLEVQPSYEGITSLNFQAQRPIIPVDWRKGKEQRTARPLPQTGLELYAMRHPPMVGREKLRDRLWQQLREVHLSQTSKTLLLAGPTGCGKTTIAKWLSETAHELGVGTYLYGYHAEQEVPSHGLPPMLMRHLRCAGLTRSEIRGRIQTLMRNVPDGESTANALTEFISPSDLDQTEGSDNTTIRFFAPVERYLVLARQLDRMSRDRALIIWIDDIHFGFETLEFVEWYAKERRSSILFLMTATSEDLANRHIETSILDTMEVNGTVQIEHIDPLSTTEQAELLESMLPLEKVLVNRIVSRTSGNPRFALDLIRALVDQGRLQLGPEGYGLKDRQRIEIPFSLTEIWDERLDTFLSKRSQSDQEALELAACLGLQVDLEEWHTLCRVADVIPSPRLSMDLVDQRFVKELRAQQGQRTWHFAHGMLREALIRHAKRLGRLEQHHAHAVNMLRVGNASASRIGKHLLAAGQLNAALGPLERAVMSAIGAGDHRAAQSAVIDWSDALRLLNFPDNRRDWLKVAMANARLLRVQGELSDSAQMTLEVIEKASRRPHLSIVAEAYLLRSNLLVDLARYEEALLFLAKLDDVEERHLSEMLQAQRAEVRATALERLGRFGEASVEFESAENQFLAMDHLVAAAIARLGRARIARAQGNHADALELAASAGRSLGSAGNRVGVSDALFQLGEVARLADELDRAEHHYRKAQRGYRDIGSHHRLEAEMKLAMVLVEREAFLESRLLLEQLMTVARHRENRRMVATLHLLLAICCSQDESWTEWTEHVEAADLILQQTPMIDFDIAIYAERAALCAYQANQINAAQLPQAIADAQFSVLRRADESNES